MKITVEMSRRNIETIAKTSGMSVEQIMEHSDMSERADAGYMGMDATIEGGVVSTMIIDDEFIDEIIDTFVTPVVALVKTFKPAIEAFAERWFNPSVIITESFILTAGRKTYDVKINEGVNISDKDLEELKFERRGIQKYKPEHLAMFDIAVEEVVSAAYQQKLDEVTEE